MLRIQDLNGLVELSDQECELISGGAVERFGQNRFNGVPFTVIVTPGQGSDTPNGNGFVQSENAIPNAFGTPFVINAG